MFIIDKNWDSKIRERIIKKSLAFSKYRNNICIMKNVYKYLQTE